MPDQPEPHPVGSHALGPHVVGTRVVVRRLLRGQTGPSGGPAMTDLLGVCTAWGDGVCVVQPETGEPVTIAVADIVSGKPVPPRPSARHRVGAREAQVRAMALFADLETRPVGDWVLRWSPTATARRANSVLAFGPVGASWTSGNGAAYDDVVGFYAAHGARPIAAVLPDSAEDELFRGRGWVPESGEADTHFQLAGVAQVRRLVSPADPGPGVEIDLTVSDDLATARILLDGHVVAGGVGAYDRDWIGLRSIETDPAHRRRGLAVAVIDALLEWGAERGAGTAYLQVLGDNAPALALYERLGFAHHHAYRYLAPPR